MSRAEVYQRLINDPGVTALVDPENIYGSLSVDTPAERPFIVMNWGAIDIGVGRSNPQLLDLWVHDDKGDFTRIDAILLAIRLSLSELQATPGITQVDWTGDGADQEDQGYQTIFRIGSFRVIGSAR